jgi:hypothetical protein
MIDQLEEELEEQRAGFLLLHFAVLHFAVLRFTRL